MSRTSVLLAALLVAPACDSSTKTDANKTADNKADAKAQDKGPEAEASKSGEDKAAKEADEKADDEAARWQAKLDARVLAQSGLDKASKLSAFDIINCETGEEYCQVCRFGPNPKLMAVGTADDEAFAEDLKNLDAIAQKYSDTKLKTFAVITPITDGKGHSPADVKAAQEQANELRERLALTIPVVVPSPDAKGANREWDEYYNITKSRTVMFADGDNVVQYSAVAPADFAALNDAIVAVVKS